MLYPTDHSYYAAALSGLDATSAHGPDRATRATSNTTGLSRPLGCCVVPSRLVFDMCVGAMCCQTCYMYPQRPSAVFTTALVPLCAGVRSTAVSRTHLFIDMCMGVYGHANRKGQQRQLQTYPSGLSGRNTVRFAPSITVIACTQKSFFCDAQTAKAWRYAVEPSR